MGIVLNRARASSNAELAYPVMVLLEQPGCAFCRRSEAEDLKAVWSFLWEGKFEVAIRDRVKAAGGFCAHHNRLVYDVAKRDDLTAGLAEIQELIIAGLRQNLDHHPKRRRRWQRKPTSLVIPAQGTCLLCQYRAEAEIRMAAFLSDRLSEPDSLERYLASDGFCLPHLRMVVAGAEPGTAARLVEDVDSRLAGIRTRLSEYRRKRDYRYRDEPRGEEQRAALDATRQLGRQRFAPHELSVITEPTPSDEEAGGSEIVHNHAGRIAGK